MYALTNFNGSNDPFAALARDFFGAPRTKARTQVTPRFDFFQSEEGYTLRGDLPGVSEENLELTVHDGILTITGKRSEEFSSEETGYLVRERSFGEFSRQLRLPKDASSEDISASLKDGVLDVSIGKRPELQARKIKIS